MGRTKPQLARINLHLDKEESLAPSCVVMPWPYFKSQHTGVIGAFVVKAHIFVKIAQCPISRAHSSSSVLVDNFDAGVTVEVVSCWEQWIVRPLPNRGLLCP